MMTAHGSVETAIEAMKRGATDYVLKPFKNDEIKLLVHRAIEQRDLMRENKALRKEQAKLGQVTNMIGVSHAIAQVKDMIRRVAVLPSTIAIHGESGVGKELVARSVHQLSDRSQRPFVAINCGGIPENLLESELFGHKRGAFTGAIEDKDGLFLVANGGTLFLDEIGEMPLALQVKLLRVLDNHLVTPLGGAQSIKVDVRIVSATNRDLDEMVREGTFREDLYYRLNVIPLHVPALRERPDDIPLLVRHFMTRHAEKLGRRLPAITPAAVDALCAYDWPGNVRELGNVIERALALSSHDQIDVNELPQNVTHHLPHASPSVTDLPPQGLDLEALIAEIEIKLIEQALARTRHSQKKAAHLLGLTARSLRYRLQKYGIGHIADLIGV
jgi:two-component system response regulator PilR (NtrC family)